MTQDDIFQKDFELELFRQINEHIRATDRKLWVATGACVSVFFFYLVRFDTTDLVMSCQVNACDMEAVISVVIHLLYGFFGTVIYLIERWYRAWKVHYLEVLYDLRIRLYGDRNNDSILPFWLRDFTAAQPMNVENIIKISTFIVSFAFVLLGAYELSELLHEKNGDIFGIAIVAIYIVIIFGIKVFNFPGRILRA